MPLSERIGKDTTVVLVYAGQETKVYFSPTPSPIRFCENLEDGDIVMLSTKSNEVRSVVFSKDMDMVLPAVYFKSGDSKIGKFTIAGTNESLVLSIDRIVL